MVFNGNGEQRSLYDVEKLNAIASIGIEYGRINGASYYLVRIPKYSIDGKRLMPKVALTSANGNIDGTKVSTLAFAKREKTIFALNASLFNVTTMQPQGQTIIDGVSVTNTPMTDDNGVAISETECYPLCIDADGNLLSPYGRNVDTADMIADGIKYALTAWGQIIDSFVKTDETKFNEIVHSYAYTRQCIGQYQNGDYVVFSADGISGGLENEAGLTYSDVADVLISKGVKYAYALDGGGSTETVLGSRHVNPIFEGALGRPVPTVIYFDIQ